MGANTFSVTVKGKSAQTAFAAARKEALYQHGHSGYSGSIAEKQEFVVITMPKGTDARAFADKLIEARDSRIDDKWGPAGCISLGNNEYLFFGWASS